VLWLKAKNDVQNRTPFASALASASFYACQQMPRCRYQYAPGFMPPAAAVQRAHTPCREDMRRVFPPVPQAGRRHKRCTPFLPHCL